MGTFLKAALAFVVVSIVVIVLAVACVGGAVNEVVKESQKGAITQQQYEAVKRGDTLKEVKDELGEPSDTQEMQSQGMRMDCIYYPVEGGDVAELYQFCFDRGELTSKSRM